LIDLFQMLGHALCFHHLIDAVFRLLS
jgi:hypothetical protein